MTASSAMPLRYLVTGAQDVIARGEGPAAALAAIGILTALTVVLTPASVRFSAGTKSDPRYGVLPGAAHRLG